MRQLAPISRRSLLAALASQSVLPAVAAPTQDAHLIALGHLFDGIATELDQAIESRSEMPEAIFDRFDSIESEILATPARTIEGLRVKARAACWALLGDIIPSHGATTDQRMALSMIRDLIQMYDPQLERPGALKALLESVTGTAVDSAERLSVSVEEEK